MTVIGSLDLSARVVDTEVRIAVSGSRMSDVVGFEPVESFVLTIPAKQMSGLATFVLTPVNDMEEANSGTLEVQGEADLPVSLALLLLLDDDDASVARAWLSRFARTVASQTVETVEERLERRSAGADHVTLAGYPILGGRGPGRSSSLSRYQGDQRWDLLARSSFSLSSSAGPREGGDAVAAGNLTAWGRGAVTDFRGNENELSVRGEVVTGTVGVDYERGRWLTGLAMGLSRGRGGVGGNSDSGLEASLTTANPYARIRIGENLMLWGVLGYGRGEFSMTEDGTTTRTDLSLTMGALGFRRDLVSSARGFGLGLESDVFLAQIDADAAPGLAAVSQDVNRVRLALETSYSRSVGGGGVLTPSFEIGVRNDGGDADQGRGVEMGVGLRYTDSDRGLRIEFAGRSLLTHQASGFEEWGGSGAVTLDPGKSGRGFALGLRSSWGAFHGGVQQLLSQGRMVDPGGRFGLHQGGRVEAEAGYGLGRAAGRVLVSPFGVVMLAEEGARGFGAGARLDFARMLSLSVEVSRRRSVREEPEDAVLLLGTLRLGPRSEPVKPVRANAAEASSASLPATSSPR